MARNARKRQLLTPFARLRGSRRTCDSSERQGSRSTEPRRGRWTSDRGHERERAPVGGSRACTFRGSGENRAKVSSSRFAVFSTTWGKRGRDLGGVHQSCCSHSIPRYRVRGLWDPCPSRRSAVRRDVSFVRSRTPPARRFHAAPPHLEVRIRILLCEHELHLDHPRNTISCPFASPLHTRDITHRLLDIHQELPRLDRRLICPPPQHPKSAFHPSPFSPCPPQLTMAHPPTPRREPPSPRALLKRVPLPRDRLRPATLTERPRLAPARRFRV